MVKRTGMRSLFILISLVLIYSVPAKAIAFDHIRVNADIELIKLGDNFYVHTSWFDFPGFGRYPSNGLIFVKNKKALLIDTPNTDEQTLVLYNFLRDRLNADITKIIVGHAHSDCMGGLSGLHQKGVESIACDKTIEVCRSHHLPVPKQSFAEELNLEFQGEQVVCRYFGPGHTVDNIVVYFPEAKILFGGCLIKSMDSGGLGNTREAILEQWDRTIINIKEAYPSITLVIPGHGAFGDLS